jgi:hypothetical protein
VKRLEEEQFCIEMECSGIRKNDCGKCRTVQEMLEEARLAAQRKAEKQARCKADRREQEAHIQAEREGTAFANRARLTTPNTRL